MNKKIPFPIALIIIAVLAVLVGGVAVWQYLEMPKEIKMPEIKPPEKITDETANWETYRNEKYGFEVKYPQNWIPHNLSAIDGIFRISFWDKDCSIECGSIDINIKNRDNKSFQQIKQEIENKYSLLFLPQAFPFKETSVDKERAFIIPGYEFILGVVTVVHEGYIYEISRVYSEKDVPEELFNQMLSTFRFIEAAETECEKWRKECAKEGENRCGPCGCKSCCSGLVSRDVTYPYRNQNNEVFCLEEMTAYTCVKCGDTICGKGEDWCICPEDCSKPNSEDLQIFIMPE